jgi:hypothetical protein
MRNKPGFIVLLLSIAWLTFAFHRHSEMMQLARTEPWILESRPPLYYSLASLASLLGVGIGCAMLIADLDQWRRKKLNERNR